MATTTVRRGTKRPAADAKRAKAAQKTPLPGDAKPGTPVDTSGLEKMALGELRQLGHALGFSTALKEGKAALVRVIRANPAGPPAVDPEVRAEVGRRQAQVTTEGESQVDAKVAKALGERVTEARKAFGRAKLAEIVGITASQLWRCEAAQSRPRPEEVPLLVGALERIDSGELLPPVKPAPFGGANAGTGPTKAALKSTLDEVAHVLSSAPVTGAKVAQLRATINAALNVVERATKTDE